MLRRLTRTLIFTMKTPQQDNFINSLPSRQMKNDQTVIEHIRYVYEHREFIEECEQVTDFVDRVENFLMKRNKCTVAHLQCYYKLKEMRLVNPLFRFNLLKKYSDYLLDLSLQIKNQHLEKYLWFLFEEGRYQRDVFEDAASNHTINLHEIYEYMNSLSALPTWEPYIRVTTMLKFLGHEITAHKGLGLRKNIDKVEHKYYPYLATLFTAEEMKSIRKEQKYDEPYVTMLAGLYFTKNLSRYDSYLQRVERVELQKHYERFLDVISWSDIVPLLDLLLLNFKMHGTNDDIDNQFLDLFFRLCEHANIDLEAIIGILDRIHRDKAFMFFRRSGIIARTLDAIQSAGIQDFSFLPADGFISLLETSTKLDIGETNISALQSFICKKAESKQVWDDYQIDKFQDFLKQSSCQGGPQLMKYLEELGRDS